jgi:hypothetical protein
MQYENSNVVFGYACGSAHFEFVPECESMRQEWKIHGEERFKLLSEERHRFQYVFRKEWGKCNDRWRYERLSIHEWQMRQRYMHDAWEDDKALQ